MPKVHGIRKRPESNALEVIKVNKSVTPADINKHVGTGDYASKYMSFLKRDGFGIKVTKDGRKVVSYTLTSRVPDDKLPPGAFERKAKAEKKAEAKKPKVEKKGEQRIGSAKEQKPKKAKTKVVVPAVNTSLPAKKVVSGKAAAKKSTKPVDETPAPAAAPVTESFAVDSAFDNFEVDLSDLA
jgi:hypothetical protein